jgi:hypothetical protein
VLHLVYCAVVSCAFSGRFSVYSPTPINSEIKSLLFSLSVATTLQGLIACPSARCCNDDESLICSFSKLMGGGTESESAPLPVLLTAWWPLGGLVAAIVSLLSVAARRVVLLLLLLLLHGLPPVLILLELLLLLGLVSLRLVVLLLWGLVRVLVVVVVSLVLLITAREVPLAAIVLGARLGLVV